MIRFATFILSILLLCACNDPEDAQWPLQPASGVYDHGVFILNEGNFDWGFGTLSFYQKQASEEAEQAIVEHEIFRAKNAYTLGNVVQSMQIINGKGYIVVNNSEKIVVVNPNTMEELGVIQMPGASPRYIHAVSSSKAYVTELYADCLWVIDLLQEQVIEKIPTTGWTESMTQVDQWLFVTQKHTVNDLRGNGEKLLKVDITSDIVLDSLSLPKGPTEVVCDQYHKLWVLCDGGLHQEAPSLNKINPYTFKIEDSFTFKNQSTYFVSNLRINQSLDTLYYINGGVYQHAITSEQLDLKPLIPKQRYNIYAIDIEPKNGNIYLADAVDYLQRGWAYRFTPSGVLLDSMQTGVIPTQFVFH